MGFDPKTAFIAFRQYFRDSLANDVPDRMNAVNVMAVFLLRHGYRVDSE